jgi:hypothetical protein
VSEHDCAIHGWQSEQEECPKCKADPIAAYRQTYNQFQVDAIKNRLRRDLDLAVLEARIEEAKWWDSRAHHHNHHDQRATREHVDWCVACRRVADLQKKIQALR